MDLPTDSVAEKAALLMQDVSKRELIALARAHGWRGDYDRTPKLQLALYCASKGLTPESTKDSDSAPATGGAEQGEGEGSGDGNSGDGEQGDGESEGKGDGSGGEQSEGEGAESDKGREGKGDKGQQSKEKREGKGEQQQQQGEGEGEAQQQQQQKPERAPDSKTWQQMLKDAAIERPHPMLRKVHALAVVAKVHVMLVGPAGCGKTMLAAQLAKLMAYTFGLNSMTAGTSESALTGWLLPVGDGGRFEYVPAPFVTNYTKGKAVHLLDEADAADANLLLVLNAALANGHFPVPHNLKQPHLDRAPDAIIMAACNTTGGGSDDLYTGRTALDASTLDRFYLVRVDYAADYEGSIFGAQAQQSKGWTPSTRDVDAALLNEAHTWLVQLRQKVNSMKLPRIISTRAFQKTRAALGAGLSLREIKSDLLMAWSPDELRRVGETI